jgi:hypothetical protein
MKRERQFRIMISDEEHAELVQLATWLRVSSADAARRAIQQLYINLRDAQRRRVSDDE